MGIAERDNETGILTIIARLYFYGDAANEELSFAIGKDVHKQWNVPGIETKIDGKKYRVQFDIKGLYAANLTQTEVNENDDPRNNYFRLEDFAAGNISFVDGIGSNTGYFKVENIINNSTTAAHEFGHTIGLEHPEVLDIRGRGIPGIMYPRGTICDSHFHYDPAVTAGQKGGTLNPHHRRVLQADIDDLHLEKLRFNNDGFAVIGAFSSVWHYRHG